MDIKIELLKLGKRQVDLLEEIRKRGFVRLYPCQLSDYIGGRNVSPQAKTVLLLCEQIIDEWKKAAK